MSKGFQGNGWGCVAKMAMMLSPLALVVIGTPLMQPIQSQPLCPNTDERTPSRTTRQVELKQFGIRVTIPSNFRTILRNGGTVSIVTPGDFNLLKCIAEGMPAPKNNAIAMESLRLRSNPENLDLQSFIQKDPTPNLSDSVESQTINGFDILMRQGEAPGSELAYALFQVDGIQGILEVTAPSKIQLLDLLKRTQLLSTDSAQAEIQTDSVQAEIQVEENLVLLALGLVKSLGYQTNSDRETITRQNNRVENPTQSTVTITQEGLLDDAIAGQQFVIQFQKNSNDQWDVLSLQKNRKCQVGRGSQEYTKELCL